VVTRQFLTTTYSNDYDFGIQTPTENPKYFWCKSFISPNQRQLWLFSHNYYLLEATYGCGQTYSVVSAKTTLEELKKIEYFLPANTEIDPDGTIGFFSGWEFTTKDGTDQYYIRCKCLLIDGIWKFFNKSFGDWFELSGDVLMTPVYL
jgi:hypothetical protein